MASSITAAASFMLMAFGTIVATLMGWAFKMVIQNAMFTTASRVLEEAMPEPPSSEAERHDYALLMVLMRYPLWCWWTQDILNTLYWLIGWRGSIWLSIAVGLITLLLVHGFATFCASEEGLALVKRLRAELEERLEESEKARDEQEELDRIREEPFEVDDVDPDQDEADWATADWDLVDRDQAEQGEVPHWDDAEED